MNKILKKALIFGGGLFLVLAIVLVVIWSNLDWVVKTMIEDVGTDTLGVEVRVESVSITLSEAKAELTGLTVRNPEGFSDGNMLYFSKIAVDLAQDSLQKSTAIIDNLTISSSEILYELTEQGSNFEAVQRHASRHDQSSSGASSGDQKASDEKEPRFAINELWIDNPKVKILAPQWIKDPLIVNLPKIEIDNIGTRPDGQSSTGKQLAVSLIDKISEKISQSAMQHVRQSGIESLQNLLEKGSNNLFDMQKGSKNQEKDIRKSLEGLLNLE